MELLPIVDLRLSGRTRRSSGCAASEALLSSLVPHGLLSQAGNFRFGSTAPGQHTPKQSLDDGQIPLAASRGRADLLESPGAMTAFVSSSH